ncbi:MAG: calcium-binding protein [Gemmobacter sp.]|uniref:calcium-binding protein n=1 Tax=Gemmobacter sp. TaxID=1898957 RepID=UPI00391D2AC6
MALREGTPDADDLVGTEFNDTIYGFDGDDTLSGLAGADRIYGGNGNDLILTGNGRDRAWGDAGNDTLRGGTGNHTLYGGAGDDWILLGFDDSYWSSYDPPQHRVGVGGSGNDFLQTTGHHNADLYGGFGVDTARLIHYSTNHSWMRVQLNGPGAGMTSGHGQTMIFDSLERLEFFADFGDHTVIGGDLDDVIHVGVGADSVEAGAGDDLVQMRASGAHTLYGGAGNDLLEVEGIWRQSVYFVVGADGSVDDGNLSVIEGFERYFVFGQGRSNDIISLGAGNDTAKGYAGSDTLIGQAGDDRLFGGFGNDSLYGGDGRDWLGGGASDDVLSGGVGRDTLVGGAGADTFLFDTFDDGPDRIVDFVSGQDRIAVASALVGGLIGPGVLETGDLTHGSPGDSRPQFVVQSTGPDGPARLFWDADGAGSGKAVLFAVLLGAPGLVAEDIVIV